MKILPTQYSKQGFDNYQIVRNEHAAIYARWRNEILVGYEVIKIKIGKDFQFNEIRFEGGEQLPSNESFGLWAWSFMSQPDYLQALDKAYQKFHKLSNMKTLDTKNEIVIQDAVRLLKSDFTELYTRLGYDKRHVSLAWHSIRVSPKGQKLLTQIFKEAPHMTQNNQAATFISDMDEEVEERAKQLAQTPSDQGSEKETEYEMVDDLEPTQDPELQEELKKEKSQEKGEKKERKAKSGTKAEQAKALILGGITDPAVLVEKVGLSKVYAQTLIKKYTA